MKRLLILTLTSILFFGCKSPEARRPVSVKTGSFIDASVERNKKLNETERNRILELIRKDKNAEYIASENGFWYSYNTKIEEDDITPEFGDIVNFKYNVSDLNGNSIYTEDELKPRDYTMDKEELFSGLREGLKLMKAGETVTFLFPSQKAYGYYGDTNKIGTSVPLICNVTINSITQTETN
ncbi:gliding motility-associated peptidyl-prolyl isomerase GldI [Pontimicrobium sp. SW4]|uniref:Peptidyl-prolyl cis-trans isomerase n=1 Tax=Pontimicrobium sp. SW4 TaxID=3153519 RepID=A0AAU7BVA6_9FLAO